MYEESAVFCSQITVISPVIVMLKRQNTLVMGQVLVIKPPANIPVRRYT